MNAVTVMVAVMQLIRGVIDAVTVYPNIPQYIPIYPNISQYTPIYPNISQYTPIYPNISQYIPIYPKIGAQKIDIGAGGPFGPNKCRVSSLWDFGELEFKNDPENKKKNPTLILTQGPGECPFNNKTQSFCFFDFVDGISRNLGKKTYSGKPPFREGPWPYGLIGPWPYGPIGPFRVL